NTPGLYPPPWRITPGRQPSSPPHFRFGPPLCDVIIIRLGDPATCWWTDEPQSQQCEHNRACYCCSASFHSLAVSPSLQFTGDLKRPFYARSLLLKHLDDLRIKKSLVRVGVLAGIRPDVFD